MTLPHLLIISLLGTTEADVFYLISNLQSIFFTSAYQVSLYFHADFLPPRHPLSMGSPVLLLFAGSTISFCVFRTSIPTDSFDHSKSSYPRRSRLLLIPTQALHTIHNQNSVILALPPIVPFPDGRVPAHSVTPQTELLLTLMILLAFSKHFPVIVWRWGTRTADGTQDPGQSLAFKLVFRLLLSSETVLDWDIYNNHSLIPDWHGPAQCLSLWS